MEVINIPLYSITSKGTSLQQGDGRSKSNHPNQSLWGQSKTNLSPPHLVLLPFATSLCSYHQICMPYITISLSLYILDKTLHVRIKTCQYLYVCVYIDMH